MYRFALRPAWLLSHLLVLTLVVVMVNLGLWQLRRLDHKQATNDLVEARIDEPPVDPGPLLVGRDFEGAEDLEYTPVSAAGVWLADDQVYVRNRSLNGAPGRWVLTPLGLGDDTAIVVNRGWIPLGVDVEGEAPELLPPTGPVVVEGFVRPTQVRQGIQPRDPTDGELLELSRVDIARLAPQVEDELLPAYIQLTDQPADVSLPVALGRPELDEGPHLSYAFQWFAFTTIALVGYPLVLRRVARDRGRKPAGPRFDHADDPPSPSEPDPASNGHDPDRSATFS